MQLLTPVNIPKPTALINHRQKILCMGSCFAENIAKRLTESGFQVTCNPWGTMYNPASIYNCLSESITDVCPTEPPIVEYQGLWHSLWHHGDFSQKDRNSCQKMLTNTKFACRKAFVESDIIIFTLGTAWVYLWENEVIVANCHKLPADRFRRVRLSVEQVSSYLKRLVDIAGPDRHVIFTVSPIRHLKDGLHENQLSKATLLLAIEQLRQQLDSLFDKVDYFPSYEILLDELRDYRFYDSDMLHPSEMAVEYIWQRFADTYFSTDTKADIQRIANYYRSLHHRPLHPETDEYRRFREQLESTYSKLAADFPWLASPDDGTKLTAN